MDNIPPGLRRQKIILQKSTTHVPLCALCVAWRYLRVRAEIELPRRTWRIFTQAECATSGYPWCPMNHPMATRLASQCNGNDYDICSSWYNPAGKTQPGRRKPGISLRAGIVWVWMLGQLWLDYGMGDHEYPPPPPPPPNSARVSLSHHFSFLFYMKCGCLQVFEGWRGFHMWLRNMREAFQLKYGVLKQVRGVRTIDTC